MAVSASAGDLVERAPTRTRLRLVTLAVVLTVVVVNLVQQPGLITFDTKLDLQFDPQSFLVRSLGLWNSDSAIGGLQNQASGYLFPMGPAFWLGIVLHQQMWVWERLWSAAVMLLAYEGARRLASRWPGVGPWGAVVAGLAYMLSPRILQTVGGLSGETLPTAVLPWTVLPIALYLQGRLSARLAFLWSAATVPFMGGQNATLVFACLVLPALLLVLVNGRSWLRRVADLVAWGVLAVAASLWWVVPLFLLGGYAPPFLDFIESAHNTAGDVGWLTALRGTSHWVAFFPGGGTAGWAGGYAVVSSRVLLLTTVVVSIVGLLGLVLTTLWARRTLLACVVLGLVVLTLGNGGWAGSVLAEWWLDALDGVLAPLRNIHKFDPVVRLPLSLGVGAFVSTALPRLVAIPASWSVQQRRAVRVAGAGAVVLAVLAVSQPALSGNLRVQGGMEDISTPWRQAAAYLDAQEGPVRAMVVPGAGFAVQTWGRTIDEPIQVLDAPPWASRGQGTVSTAGTIRFLDGIERELAAGRPTPDLGAAFERMGLTHLVVRNDLDLDATDAPPPDVVYAALSGVTGLRPVASFGESDGGHPAVEVFELDGATPDPRVSLVDWPERRVVQGGPEVVADLQGVGLLDSHQPSSFATGPGEPADILTDSNRRVERAFGRIDDAVSAVMTPDEPFRLTRPRHDFVGPEIPGELATAEYEGAAEVTASSSEGYADIIGPIRPERGPYAAFDRSALTAWTSAPLTDPVGQWIQASFAGPEPVDQVSLWFDTVTGADVTTVQVTTDSGSVTADLDDDGRVDGINLEGGESSFVRVTVLQADPGPTQVRLVNVELGDHEIRRSIRLPGVATADSSVYVSSELPQRSCVQTDDGVSCQQVDTVETPETPGFDRIVEVAEPAAWLVEGRAVATGGPAVERLLAPLSDRLITATASSTFGGDPLVAAANAVDGRRDTGWYASPIDQDPVLKLSWKKKRTITRVLAHLDPGQPGALPDGIVVDPLTREKDVQLVATTGPTAGQMEPVRTNKLRISLLKDTAPEDGLGISELDIGGADDLKYRASSDTPTGLVCGFGPTVQVDGQTLQTQVSGTIGDVLSGAELAVYPCGAFGVNVGAGDQNVQVTNPQGFAVSRMWFQPPDAASGGAGDAATPAPATASVVSWSSAERTVDVEATQDVALVVPESANPGWVASLDGQHLQPVVVDGWKQGWVLPAGSRGEVTLRFTPQGTFVVSIVVGLAVAALVVVSALVTLGWWFRRRSPSRTGTTVPAERHLQGWRTSPRGRRVALVVAALLLCVVSVPFALGVAAGFLTRRVDARSLGILCVGGLLLAALVAIGSSAVVVPPALSDTLVAFVVGSICGAVVRGRGQLGGTTT